jgi:calcineurin-like phosphoesterase family protein
MNAGIIEVINDTVSPGDELWCIGDICMGKISDSLLLISQIKCQVKLVPGNHDRVSRSYRNDQSHIDKWLKIYSDAGISVMPEYIPDFLGLGFDISHFPVFGDSQDEDRYNEFRPPNNGRWLVHGHVHDKWRQNVRQINVGIDAWGRLLTLDDILDIKNAGPNNDPVLK